MTAREEYAVPLEEAMARLKVHDDRVHTFVGGPGLLIGADWDLDDVRKAFEEHGVEETGPGMKGMGHGLAVIRPDGGPVFFEVEDE